MSLYIKTTSLLQTLESKVDSLYTRFAGERVLYAIACTFLGFVIALFLLATLGFIAHIPINKFYLPIAFILSLIPLFTLRKMRLGGGQPLLQDLSQASTQKSQQILAWGVVILGFSMSLLAAWALYDYSWDGRAYHQIGIYYLANDWNPVWQKMADLKELAPYLSHEIWVEHYMKFSEIVAACIYSVFSHNIELGKAVNFIAFFGAFFYGISVIAKFLRPLHAIIASFLLSFSPTLVAQIASYYVDGLLATALLVVFLAIVDREYYRTQLARNPQDTLLRKSLRQRSCILALALLASASIKLTGLAYAGFIGLAYLGYVLWFYGVRESKGVLLTGLVAGGLIIVCNANPLLTNLAQGKHPGYPLLGKEKIDIIIGQQPEAFNDFNSAKKLFYSLFSRTQNCIKDCTPVLKVPFSFDKDERLQIDTRVAGFGVLFSGMIVLSVLFVLLCRAHLRNKQILALLGLVLASVLINPEAWWARYAPQLYFLPIIILALSYYLAPKPFGSLMRLALLVSICINLAFYIDVAYRSGKGYKKHIAHTIAQAKEHIQSGEELRIYSGGMEHSLLIKLNEAGVPFTRVYDKDDPSLERVPGSLWDISWNIKSQQ